jgi:hypothetical protein
MQDTPELLMCVFPVDMASYNSEAIKVIKSQEEHLAVLMCVDSHYAVAEVFLKDRIMKISNGLDMPLQKLYHQAKYVPEMIGEALLNTFVNIIGHQMGATIVMNGIPAWNLLLDDFLYQGNGHNCGLIACLKFVGLFNIMPKKDILGSNLTFRQLVKQQDTTMFKQITFDLVIAQWTSLHDIVKGKKVICMCHDNDQISSMEWRFMTSCGHLFHYPCITTITKSTGLCPACGNDPPPTVVPAKRDNAQ